MDEGCGVDPAGDVGEDGSTRRGSADGSTFAVAEMAGLVEGYQC